jgi:hypothetical protein
MAGGRRSGVGGEDAARNNYCWGSGGREAKVGVAGRRAEAEQRAGRGVIVVQHDIAGREWAARLWVRDGRGVGKGGRLVFGQAAGAMEGVRMFKRLSKLRGLCVLRLFSGSAGQTLSSRPGGGRQQGKTEQRANAAEVDCVVCGDEV